MNAGIADPVKRSCISKAFLWLKNSNPCLVLIPCANLAGLGVITLSSHLETPSDPNHQATTPPDPSKSLFAPSLTTITTDNVSYAIWTSSERVAYTPTSRNLSQARTLVIDSLV